MGEMGELLFMTQHLKYLFLELELRLGVPSQVTESCLLLSLKNKTFPLKILSVKELDI